MTRAATVDEYIRNADRWKPELKRLREILLASGLEETIKWGAPCYTHNGRNVVTLGAFKSYVGVWFHQGAQLSDPKGVLVNAQTGKTKAMRQWRFENDKDIKPRILASYLKEACAIEDAGKAIKPDRAKPLALPPELTAALAKNPKTKTAFNAMTKGKRREYADYIADAKRAETKARRIEKIMPMIAAGAGLNDKYRC